MGLLSLLALNPNAMADCGNLWQLLELTSKEPSGDTERTFMTEWGFLFGHPYDKDFHASGYMLGSPLYVWKLPFRQLLQVFDI